MFLLGERCIFFVWDKRIALITVISIRRLLSALLHSTFPQSLAHYLISKRKHWLILAAFSTTSVHEWLPSASDKAARPDKEAIKLAMLWQHTAMEKLADVSIIGHIGEQNVDIDK
jgi:hypothetical protein